MTSSADGSAPVQRRRGSLARQISLLTAAVAVITAVVAGSLSLGLVRAADERSARTTLARLATAAADSTDRSANSRAAQARARRTLEAVTVRVAFVSPAGAVRGDALAISAYQALSEAQRRQLSDSGKLSRSVADPSGRRVFVEARSTSLGGIVLAQRRADALAQGNQALNRVIVALLIGVAVALVLGLLLAWRLARPLRRTAQAAHALADGHRDVRIPLQGPAEVAEVGAAVNALAAALSVSERRQREFLLSVSHDLRTPLTAISGYAESLADSTVPPDQTAYVGGVVLGEAKRLNRLVGDLLDLARLDADDFRIEAVRTDLVAVASAAAQVWDQRCTSAGVRFSLAVPTSALITVTDAARVRQIADGLLENALRVTPAGAPIVLAVRSEAAAAVLEVRDGGPGLSDDDLSVAFEQSALYERYRGVRKVGTGLGLAIVARLTSRLGGTVEAGHAAEGGARFTVRLPALAALDRGQVELLPP